MDFNYQPQTKSNSNLKIKIIVSFLVIVLLSGAYYFLLLKNKETNEDSPPGLELGSGGFQGSIEDGKGFLQYTSQDVTAYQVPDYPPNELKKGLHVYYSTTNISVSELIKRIKAVEHNKILILFFSPEEKDGLSKGMYAYPKGPYTNTKLITAPDSFIIPAYRGFLMISTKDTNIYGIENEKKPMGDDAASSIAIYSILNGINSGWILIPSMSDMVVFNDIFNANEAIKLRIDKMFIQEEGSYEFAKIEPSPNGKFEKVNFDDGYYMIWIKLKLPVTVQNEGDTKTVLSGGDNYTITVSKADPDAEKCTFDINGTDATLGIDEPELFEEGDSLIEITVVGVSEGPPPICEYSYETMEDYCADSSHPCHLGVLEI